MHRARTSHGGPVLQGGGTRLRRPSTASRVASVVLLLLAACLLWGARRPRRRDDRSSPVDDDQHAGKHHHRAAARWRRQAARRPASRPPPSASATATIFAVIGDYGMDDGNEAAVAKLVTSWRPAYVITTGDDYYSPAGGTGTGKYDESTGAYYGAWLKDITTTGKRLPGRDWLRSTRSSPLSATMTTVRLLPDPRPTSSTSTCPAPASPTAPVTSGTTISWRAPSTSSCSIPTKRSRTARAAPRGRPRG